MKFRDENSSFSAPRSIFESSLLGSTLSDYVTPPSTKYESISRNIDANLAEIDMETFRSEDINAVFRQQGGEECASLSESMFNDDSISLR